MEHDEPDLHDAFGLAQPLDVFSDIHRALTSEYVIGILVAAGHIDSI